MSLSKPVKSWALYDFANSSYVLIFQSFLLPVFFSNVLSIQGVTLGSWGLVNGVSTVLGVAFALIAGGYADRNIRINVLRNFIGMSFIGMTALSLSINSFMQAVPYLFVITNAFFIATISLSDSILPYLSNNKDQTFINSGYAWGFGYLGGIVCLLIVVLMQKLFGEFSAFAFMSVAVFYIVFSVFALRGLRSVDLNAKQAEDEIPLVDMSRKDRGLLLVGVWLISECITVIILFYSIYASTEIGLSSFEIGMTLLVVQLVGFPATYYGARILVNHSYVRMLGATILLWCIVIFLLVMNYGRIGLTIIVVLTGLVIGNSQSYLRSIWSLVTNRPSSGMQFGIYALVSQAAVLIGPIAYGYASDLLGSQKIPLITTGFVMVAGYWVVANAFRKKERMPIQ